jgi:hypothetical protein
LDRTARSSSRADRSPAMKVGAIPSRPRVRRRQGRGVRCGVPAVVFGSVMGEAQQLPSSRAG